jgi:hypothetical protein
MRKRLINLPPANARGERNWMDLSAATVEVSSEDPQHPIDSALTLDERSSTGWRAAAPGRQIVRIVFDQPQRISRIHLVFHEPVLPRSQEFVLAWSGDNGESFREVVRQQWNFSPAGATTETEDYRVELDGVTVLELALDPDTRGGAATASLARLRLA